MNYILHRSDNYLQHFGIRGQKWGIRRFQNEDGSYKSGAEGRYAQPVKGTISGPKYNASSSGPFSYVGSGAGKKSVGVKVSDKYGKISGGGGGGSKASETEEEIKEKIDRKNIHIYDVSEKLPEKGSKISKGGSGKGSSSSKKTESEKKEKEENKEENKEEKKEEKKSSFKPDDLYSKIDGLELDSLSDTDQKELDDLITEWRTYRSTHTSLNKKSREIDEFIQRYERWKSDKKNPRDNATNDSAKRGINLPNKVNITKKVRLLDTDYKGSLGQKSGFTKEQKNQKKVKFSNVMKKMRHSDNNENDYELYHHGVLGMKWGIRRYQNPDGTLTAEGKQRYQTDKKFASKIDKDRKIRNINKIQSGSYSYGSQQRADVNNKHHNILSTAARTYGDETTYAMFMGKNGTKGAYDVGRMAANAALNYLSKKNYERIAQDYALREYNQDGTKKVREGSGEQAKLNMKRASKQAISELGFTVAKAASNILFTELSRRSQRTGARQPYDINGKWAKSGRERSYQYRLG